MPHPHVFFAAATTAGHLHLSSLEHMTLAATCEARSVLIARAKLLEKVRHCNDDATSPFTEQ
jgi:hypothetical protein